MKKLISAVVTVGMMSSLWAAAQDQPHGGAPAADGAAAEVTQVKTQTTCPVMGGKINKNLYVDHDGKRVFVCCPECIAPLKKDPATYIKKLEDAGVSVAKAQTICPVMGGKVNKNLFVDHDGKRIYMCCAGCRNAMKADPEKYIKKLESEGVSLDQAVNNAEKKDAATGGHEGHHH